MKVVICGAGPVGALAALYAARRGHEVEVYEMRGDITTEEKQLSGQLGKSINITMSDRGFEALGASGDANLVQDVIDGTIPVYAREVHDTDPLGRPKTTKIKYDAGGKHLNVVSRGALRDLLLHRLLGLPNAKIIFNRKLVHADLDARVAVFADSTVADAFSKDQRYEKVTFDLIVGADGTHSAVRHQMARYTHLDLAQTWLDTWWSEFQISASRDGKPKMALDTLHVWPQRSFMFLALPNPDGSFTCNLFAPKAVFDQLAFAQVKGAQGSKTNTDEDPLKVFFDQNFPGIIPNLMTAAELRDQFSRTTPAALHTMRVSPVNVGDRAVLIGDAAHTMVPFYGQGLNTGLEDVKVLFERHLLAAEDSLSNLLPGGLPRVPSFRLSEYSAHRQPDVGVMTTLALNNYAEMRLAQRSSLKMARRAVEETLQVRFPSLGWKTLYARVAFTTESFTEIQRKNARQGVVLATLGVAAVAFGVLVLLGLLRRWLWELVPALVSH